MLQRLLLSSSVILSVGLLSKVEAASPLDAVTADAEVVIRLGNPRETIDKAAEMAATVRSSLGDQMRTWGDGLGLYISNPTMAGVDRSRDWYAAVFAHAEEDPDVVFIIPATNTEVLQAALPDRMASFVHEDWVFYSEREEALKRVQQNRSNVAAVSADIRSVMSDAAQRIFDDSDMSVFVNVTQLNEIYSRRLGAHQTQLEDRIKRRMSLLALIPGVDPDALVGGGSEAIGQSVEDCTSFTGGVVLSNEGVNIDTYAEFAEGSPTAGAVEGMSSAGMSSLSDLPPDSLLYVGVAGGLARSFDWGLSTSASAVKPDGKRREEFEELQASLEDVDYDSMVAALGVGDSETGYIRFVGITSASPAADLRAAKQQLGDLLEGEDPRQGLTQTAEYEEGAESYGDVEADLLTITQKIDPEINPFFAQIMDQLQDTLYGPDGLQVRLLFEEDRYLQATGGGREAMERAVAQFTSDSGNGRDADLAHLIDKPAIVVLLDLQRIVKLALQEASKNPLFEGMPLDPSMFGGANPESSYIGLSLASNSTALRSRSHVPPVQLIRMVQLGMLLKMLQQQ
jgi:hypothetical protein